MVLQRLKLPIQGVEFTLQTFNLFFTFADFGLQRGLTSTCFGVFLLQFGVRFRARFQVCPGGAPEKVDLIARELLCVLQMDRVQLTDLADKRDPPVEKLLHALWPVGHRTPLQFANGIGRVWCNGVMCDKLLVPRT